MSGRAWAWCRHLRDGGTTPWAAWRTESDGARGPYLPGAQQLELLRRLNDAGPPSPGLAERVLAASAPGRGRPDLELVGAAPARGFGPRPVDPAELPADELLRVAAGLLAEDLVAAGLPEPPPAGRVRPWRRAVRVAGDPWRAATVREELVRRGRPPGGHRPVVVLIGGGLDTLLRHAYLNRVFTAGGPPWPVWLGRAARHDRLPPRADLADSVAWWRERFGRERVRLVLDDGALPRLLGARALPASPEPSAAAVELARRVGAPLGLLVVPDRRAALLRRTLLPRLLDADPDGARPTLPERHRPWVAERAERLRESVAAADYPVVGSPDRLRPAPAGPRPGATDDDVLALALRLLLAGTEVTR